MKVLQHGQPITYKQECVGCGVILEYTDDDICTVQTSSKKHIICPECRNLIFVSEPDEEPEEKILTIDNIQFPEDFYQFGTSEHAVKIDDEEINERIQKCLKNLKADKKDYGVFHYIGSGDSVVIVVKHEDEYMIFVCKDYYEANILR